MKRLTLLFILIQVFSIGFSQNKLLTIDEAVMGQWQQLYPKTLYNLQWKGNSSIFTFQDATKIYQQSVTSVDSTVFLTLEELNKALHNIDLDSIKRIPYIQWENENELHFYSKNTWCLYSVSEKKITETIEIPAEAENKTLFFKNKSIAYTIENNLYVVKTGAKPFAITNDQNKENVYGQSVSRNEFGINGGIFWSPNGTLIAFYRKDESQVKNYPLVDITAREAEADPIKYPMAGMKSEKVSLGVYNFASQKTVYIEKEDTVSEKYLTNITWSPDEKSIYIQVLNRAQNHMKLNKYNAENGTLINTLFEVTNPKYVEPEHPLIFIDGKSDKFIYQTRNNGYNHAYLYSDNGKLIRQITTGKWEITDILSVDKNDMYYISTQESPLERHLYKVNIKNGKTEKLTQVKGTHSIVLNKATGYFIDKYSSTTIPNNIDIVSIKGDKVRKVLSASNPLKDFKMPEMEINTIKAADNNTDLYYRLIKPVDFDPTKKYPAIIYVYGGPHAQLIQDRWLGSARLWQYYMAQKGYVMFTIDNRGSANRGLEFENVIHRQCGINEMNDQIEGVKFLKELGFVDENKIGIHGWSYGGFMTTSLMVNYPDIFKVGVAGGPVIDWKYYEVMYGERYMDTPEENPEGYESTSLLPKAKDLEGKLMIIHGAMDPTVVWQNSQLFLLECIKNQIPIDYFVYPLSGHNMRGGTRIHLMQKVSDYFDDYLK